MRMIATFICFFCLLSEVLSQVKTESKVINFGLIQRGSDKVRDIVIENTGSKKTLILKSNFSREFDILFSSREILPDSSVILRVKFKPISQGPFSEKVEIWFSTENKPLLLEFEADVAWLDPADNSPCPDFNAQPYDCCPNNQFEVKVMDAETNKPVNARLRVVNDGRVLIDERIGQKGTFTAEVPVSWYFMEASLEGYESADTATYINTRKNYFELFLRPERTAEHQEEIQSQPISTVVKSENAERDSVIADTGRPDDVIVAGGESFYRRNNVVFLIDVSQSMAGMGKMDLLKASMSELVDELREIDNVSVVTYASDAKLVLPQTDGSKKEYILNTINALFAGGMTSGTRGFRMAYETAAKGYIEEGNNQVIVVTDGAFRASDNPMIVEMAQKQLQKGVKTSIVGIKSKPLAIISLTEIASWGGGNFVSINNLDQASEALLKEVRQQSAR